MNFLNSSPVHECIRTTTVWYHSRIISWIMPWVILYDSYNIFYITCNSGDTIPFGNSACVAFLEDGTMPHWSIRTDKSWMHHLVSGWTSVGWIKNHHNVQIHHHLEKRNIELILDFWAAQTWIEPVSNSNGQLEFRKHFQKLILMDNNEYWIDNPTTSWMPSFHKCLQSLRW